jgi:pimeloyl-ACP methyl ester carboxylesterase
MQYFRVDDGEHIHVEISGDGPPMVLLHGWTASHHDWSPFLTAFEPHHRIFRWDARAHGCHLRRTETPPTVGRMAHDLEQLMTFWDIHDAVLVGHSMGALTLWQYLRDFGSTRLSRVVIIDQSPKLVTDAGWANGIYGDFDHARNEAFKRELTRDFPETVLRLVANGLNERGRVKYLENGEGFQVARERLSGLSPQPLIDCWASLTEADYRDVLGRIDVPALLVYGSQSNFYSQQTAEYVRDAIRDAALKVYEGVDHAPHLWRGDRFVSDVLAFTGAECAESC